MDSRPFVVETSATGPARRTPRGDSTSGSRRGLPSDCRPPIGSDPPAHAGATGGRRGPRRTPDGCRREHVMMSNSPRAPQRIARRNVFFPVERPVPVEAGDRVQVTMRIVPERMIVVWDVEIRDAAAPETAAPRAASRHSTLLGMLVCREDLERQHPRFVPRLTPRGDARLSVLRLCDGVPRGDRAGSLRATPGPVSIGRRGQRLRGRGRRRVLPVGRVPYRIYHVSLDSDLPLPELPRTDAGTPDFVFHLSTAEPAPPNADRWLRRWSHADGRPWLSIGLAAEHLLFRFHEQADFLVALEGREICCAPHARTSPETV